MQQGSEEGSGEGLGGLVQPGQVQQGSGEEGSGEGPGGFVRFNRVSSLGSFGAEPGQVQQGSGEGSGEGVTVGGLGAEPG